MGCLINSWALKKVVCGSSLVHCTNCPRGGTIPHSIPPPTVAFQNILLYTHQKFSFDTLKGNTSNDKKCTIVNYFIIRKFIDSILNNVGGIGKHTYTELIFRSVAYTVYNLPWLVG
jgi:hypothetical protein